MQNQNWLYFLLGGLVIGFLVIFIYNYSLLTRALGDPDQSRQIEKTVALHENYPSLYYYPYSYFYQPWWRSSYYWPNYNWIYDSPNYYRWSGSYGYNYPSSTVVYRSGHRRSRWLGHRGRRGRSPGRRGKKGRSMSRGRSGSRSRRGRR